MLAPKILVVEDLEQFRQFVVSTLQQTGRLQVIEASSGSEALQTAEEQQLDWVLLDISLPDLNGIEVARRLQRFSDPPKVVFLSQESSPEVVREALGLGASNAARYPFSAWEKVSTASLGSRSIRWCCVDLSNPPR